MQTLSAKLKGHFTLGWSHYVVLLSIDNAEARRFYEIEATDDWSVRELRRQIDASLYERLALGHDKEEVRRLAQDRNSPPNLKMFAGNLNDPNAEARHEAKNGTE